MKKDLKSGSNAFLRTIMKDAMNYPLPDRREITNVNLLYIEHVKSEKDAINYYKQIINSLVRNRLI